MSEPVKHSEIEDVLSSIRRLVSEKDRKPTGTDDHKSQASLDRLVLTDALRVPEPKEAPQEDDASVAEAQDDSADTADASLETSDAEAPLETVDHFEFSPRKPVGPQSVGHFGDDTIVKEPVEDVAKEKAKDKTDDAAATAEITDVSALAGRAAEAAPTAPDPKSEDEDSDTGAAAEAEDAPAEDTAEDHGERPMFEGIAAKMAEQHDAPWRDPETTLYEAAGITSEDEVADAADALPAESADSAPEPGAVAEDSVAEEAPEDIRPLTEKIAALEEVIGQTDDQWEPDDPGADDYAGTEVETLEWEDNAEDEPDADADIPMFRHTVLKDADEIAEPTGQGTDVVVEAAPDAVPDTTEAEETLDEAALRQLVSDIVREELQGVLGERITRNVRKLVRREIQRALSLHDLE